MSSLCVTESTPVHGLTHDSRRRAEVSFNDAIYIRSTRGGPEIMANFCHHAFDEFVIKVGDRRTTVDKYPFSIDAIPSRLSGFMQRMSMDNYGFVPNLLMPVFYSKCEEVWIKHNGGWDIPPLRGVILNGVVGLITTTDDSIALFLDNPERDVLIRHDGELSLLKDPFWTENRLLLFEDIPYTLKSP